MLTGLDEIDWTDLEHAYGAAEDTPELLRALAADDEDEAGEALSELVGSVFHQGTVYSATVPAVPFLAELASTAPHQRADILATVGMLADPHHAYGDEAVEVREAVRAEADRFPPMLDDPEPEIRAAAAYTVAQCGDRLPAAVLRDRWAAEDEPSVRASLVLALGLRDPAGSAGLLATALRDEEPSVRIAAAVAVLRAGLPWPDGAVEALAEVVGPDAELDYVWQRSGEALDELAVEADDDFVVDLLGRLLDAGPEARAAALYAMSERCRARRSAPALLLPLVARVIDDPVDGVRREAVGLLRMAGAAAGGYADDLARIAAGYSEVAGLVAITPERKTVEALAMLADPRWVDAVCAAWAAGHEVRPPVDEPAFDEGVLRAVRERLAGSTERLVVTGLAAVVRAWGSAAAAAEPELVAALPVAPAPVSAALAAVGVLPPAAARELRATAEEGDLQAGLALWRLTGETGPLVAAVGAQLDRDERINDRQLLRVVTAAPALGALVPRLRPYLTGEALRTYPERHVQVFAARVVWAVTGEREAVLPTVRAVLAGGDLPASAAAELVSLLGEATLTPQLRELLTDEWARVGAARALHRQGVPADELAPTLLRAIEEEYGARDALLTLVEMGARAALPGLRELAERDRRVVTSGVDVDIVWRDEQFQRELREAVRALAT